MTKSSKSPVTCGGVDVGKAMLAFAVEGAAVAETCANTPQGRRAMIGYFRSHGVVRVGLESTATYHVPAADELRAEGIEVVVFQPAQVKAFAKFHKVKAKSDALDALLIARCTAGLKAVRPAPDPRLAPFAEHLTFIEQIEEDIARLKTRRDRYDNPRFLAANREETTRLTRIKKQEIAALEKDLRQHPDLARRLALLQSIQGVGLRTALCLLLRMPELGSLSREEAASLLGVAPFVHESGRYKGQRRTGGGRARARTSLFAAAQIASRCWNPPLMALKKRLTKAGKPYTLTLVACTRKLVIFANTVLARGTPWRNVPIPQQAT